MFQGLSQLPQELLPQVMQQEPFLLLPVTQSEPLPQEEYLSLPVTAFLLLLPALSILVQLLLQLVLQPEEPLPSRQLQVAQPVAPVTQVELSQLQLVPEEQALAQVTMVEQSL